MLALLVGAGLFFSRPAEPPPSDIKLAIGKPFVQGIISLFDMKVDNILLQKPESQWSHFAVGMLAFDLLIDIHMARGCPAPRPAYHSRLCVRRDVATAYPGPVRGAVRGPAAPRVLLPSSSLPNHPRVPPAHTHARTHTKDP